MDDHKRKKKRGGTKIFRSCFPSFDEKLLSYDKSDHRNARNKRLRKPVLMAVSGHNGKDSVHNVGFVNGGVTGGEGGHDSYYKRFSHRRIIAGLLKSLWFDSLMVKKIHRTLKSSIRSDKIKPILSIENTGNSTIDTENSSSHPSNSLSSSSSFSSSTNSNSQQSSDQNTSSPTDSVDFKHHNISNPQSYLDKKVPHRLDSSNTVWKLDTRKIKSVGTNSNIRMCLFFLLSLVVLIVYGRIYSILFTSTWFYLLPRPGVKRVNSVLTATESPETQYTKRVIMGGLLDKARNPLR